VPVRAIRWLLLLTLGISASSCAVMMSEQGHEGGSGQLSDAAAQAHADSTTRFKVPPSDVGYTTTRLSRRLT
jgi:hypothetical protein